MSDTQIRLTFQPQGRSVHVLIGTTVFEAAGRAGLALAAPCGGAGTCGKCRVRFTSGAVQPTDADIQFFTAGQLDEGWRLACQAKPAGDCVVELPTGALAGDAAQIVTHGDDAKADVAPAVRKVTFKLPSPELGDDAADLPRLQRELGPVKAQLGLLRALPGLLREHSFSGTAVLTDHRLIDIEPGDTTGRCFGLAVDVGTTTLAAALVDLTTGRDVGVASRVNPQVSYGDDVLSRIAHASSSAGRQQLGRAVVSAIEEMIEELCHHASVSRREIYEATFAGNTTMQHLLCGLDVTPLGQVPFCPTCRRGLLFDASEIDVAIHPRGRAYVFPVVGGFVGGDTVAGMLSTAIDQAQGPTLMIDVGTNGEIVLVHDGQIHAASTAAGPAFEGARISCGMRATRGAIEKVVFEGDIRLGVIGDAPATGLCGSGLIDLVAGLLDAGLVTAEGRLLGPDEAPSSVAPELKRRLMGDDRGQPEFVLAEAAGASQPRVTITQRDIRELQLASGAIRAGIAILLRQAGVEPGDLHRVLIAGGFGSFIRRNHAQRLGLLPPQVDRTRISYVGNASLTGARWALLSTVSRQRAEQLAAGARHVELSQDMQFQMEFAEAMIFPQ
jgi:uncharacterized 2Fe-2S/4Fe-4S cluster protein (DUF4445 family)